MALAVARCPPPSRGLSNRRSPTSKQLGQNLQFLEEFGGYWGRSGFILPTWCLSDFTASKRAACLIPRSLGPRRMLAASSFCSWLSLGTR